MAQDQAESTREPTNYRRYINQFQSDIIKSIRQLERINTKICRQKCLYCLITHTHTHAHTHKHTHIYICVCVCARARVCVCVCVCVCVYVLYSVSFRDYEPGIFIYRIYDKFHMIQKEYSMYKY